MAYKRFLAVGCSHGHLADPAALKAVLKFRASWRPHRTIHLGDFIDTAAFRGGSAGTADEAALIEPDLGHGLNFLKKLEPTDILIGNHEDRLWEAAAHYNAIKSELARRMIQDIRDTASGLKAQLIDHYDINRSWIQLGDTKFLHGFMWGEQALRDHAEHFGKCVIAHVHKTGEVQARRSDHATGWCVGTLANIPSMHYASRRRATAAWNYGLVYGEFNDRECHVNLSSAPQNAIGEWRLPSV